MSATTMFSRDDVKIIDPGNYGITLKCVGIPFTICIMLLLF